MQDSFVCDVGIIFFSCIKMLYAWIHLCGEEPLLGAEERKSGGFLFIVTDTHRVRKISNNNSPLNERFVESK